MINSRCRCSSSSKMAATLPHLIDRKETNNWLVVSPWLFQPSSTITLVKSKRAAWLNYCIPIQVSLVLNQKLAGSVANLGIVIARRSAAFIGMSGALPQILCAVIKYPLIVHIPNSLFIMLSYVQPGLTSTSKSVNIPIVHKSRIFASLSGISHQLKRV